jgi:hypothetical protein
VLVTSLARLLLHARGGCAHTPPVTIDLQQPDGALVGSAELNGCQMVQGGVGGDIRLQVQYT